MWGLGVEGSWEAVGVGLLEGLCRGLWPRLVLRLLLLLLPVVVGRGVAMLGQGQQVVVVVVLLVGVVVRI